MGGKRAAISGEGGMAAVEVEVHGVSDGAMRVLWGAERAMEEGGVEVVMGFIGLAVARGGEEAALMRVGEAAIDGAKGGVVGRRW